MRKALVIALGMGLVFTMFVLGARAAPIAYGHTLGGPSGEYGSAIDVDAAGNIYVLGTTSPVNGSNGSSGDLVVAKFSPMGVPIWQRELGVAGSLSPTDLVVNASGNAFFDGSVDINGTWDGFLGMLAPDGSLGFLRTFPMSPNGLAWNAATSSVIVTGDGVGGYGNGFVASFAVSGTLEWMRSASLSASASGWGVATNATGAVYVAVDRPDLNQASLAEFAGNGTVLAQRRLNQTGAGEYTWDVAASPSGEVGFLGYDFSYGRPILAGFDSSLTPQWSYFVNRSQLYEQLVRLAAHPDGSFFAVGGYSDGTSGTSGSAVLHLAANGTLIADDGYNSFGPSGLFQFGDLAVQTDGSLLLAGSSYGSPMRNSTALGAQMSATPGSWIVDNVAWASNTTTLSPIAVTVSDPGFAVDDFSDAASSQIWWGAVDVPAPTLQVGVTATVPPFGSLNRTANFTSNVTGGTSPYTYRWSFGDGNFSSAADPVHTYAQGGVYPVQLWVNDSAGDVGYNFTTVTFLAPPVISYAVASPNVTYIGNYVYFYAYASDPNGGYITNYHWDFGDHTAIDSSYNSVYHWYTQTGTYTVNLTVSESEGLNATTSLTVQVLDQPPSVYLNMYPNPTLVGLNASYYVSAYDYDGYIVSWYLAFGDGTSASYPSGGNSTSGVHAYSHTGTFTVSFRATDNAGLSSTYFLNETVYANTPPVASFTVNPFPYGNTSSSVVAPNQTVGFDGSASYARNPGAWITQYVWNFGDGTTSYGYYYPYAYHAFALGGRTYHVSLTVYDSYGVTGRTTKDVYVDAPPVAEIETPRDVAKVGTPFVLNGTASNDSDGSVRRWVWWFGDGGTSSGAVVSHVYAATGVYTVTLQVYDNNNLSASTTLSVSVVLPKSPTAVLAYAPSRAFAGNAVAFNAAGSSDPDGALTSYTWQFGDGGTGTGAFTNHTYAMPGTFSVILTVEDEDGMTDTSTVTIQVVSRPVAAFVASPSAPAVGDAVTFSAQGSSDLSGSLTYTWSFGDGSYGTGWQATHAYAAAGAYPVTLTVTNAYGVNATVTQTVVVAQPGLATAVVSSVGWLALGVVVGAAAVGLVIYLLRRRQKGGPAPPPPPP